MIVKNEAENLPRCLESVRNAVDELIVLDTGSTDDSVAIAQSWGAKVHHFPWNNSFADARNQALKFVTSDWVLVLDADEVLVQAAVPMLKQAMQQQAIVINLVRQEIGAAQSPYSQVSRLFRNHPQVRFSRPYHAIVDDSVAQIMQHEPQWKVRHCPDVAILHYGYEPGTIASRNKLETARTLMEGFWATHPSDPYVCSKLGALYVQMDDVQRGVELLQQGLQAQSDAPVRYELHYHLGIAQSRLQNFAQAERHYHLAIAQPLLDALKLGAYNNLGSLLLQKGDWMGAKAIFEQILTIDPDFAVGHYNLGMTLKAIGQMTQAIKQYQQAIRLNPSYAEAYQNLGVVLLKLGRMPESLEAFGKAIALHQPQNPAAADRLRQGLQQMGFQVD